MIDGCKYTYKELAEQRLPPLMEEMKKSVKTPIYMSRIGQFGIGEKTILHDLGKKNDIKGCYVLLENDSPVYVGISGNIIHRLTQHVKGDTHSKASLAYRIAMDNYKHKMPRKEAMKHSEFRKHFEKAKKRISRMNVSFIEIENDLELYLFEVFCSMELNTSRWNTFKTH